MRLLTNDLSNDLSDIFYDALHTRFTFIFSCEDSSYPESFQHYINYSILTVEDVDKLWVKFINKLARRKIIYDNVDSFIMTILHEIGHIYTWYQFSHKEISEYKKLKRQYEKEGTIESLEKYFNLPIELVASKFAVNWAVNNNDVYTYLRDRVCNALNRFYKLNNIEGEEECLTD